MYNIYIYTYNIYICTCVLYIYKHLWLIMHRHMHTYAHMRFCSLHILSPHPTAKLQDSLLSRQVPEVQQRSIGILYLKRTCSFRLPKPIIVEFKFFIGWQFELFSSMNLIAPTKTTGSGPILGILSHLP